MEMLFALVLGAALVAVVGHALWLAIAAVFRALGLAQEQAPPERPRRPRQTPRCPACDARLVDAEGVCPGCGLDPEGKLAGQLRDLETTRFVVARLVDREEIDLETGSRLAE